jgi:hypothetical protein
MFFTRTGCDTHSEHVTVSGEFMPSRYANFNMAIELRNKCVRGDP